MRIQFCDLCNESVPQADLVQGRAVQRNGRVICAPCEAAMSVGGHAAEAPAGSPAEVRSGRGDASGPAPITPIPAPSHGARPAKPVRRVAHAASGGMVGLLFTLFTIVTLALLGGGAYLFDQYQVRNARLHEELGELRLSLEAESGRADDLAARLRASTAGLPGTQRAVAEVGDRLDALESRIAGADRAGEGARAALDAERAEIARALEAFDRQGAELEQVAGTVAELYARVLELGAEVDAAAAAAPVATGEPAVPEPSPDPDWFADLPKLTSTNPGQRWEAVTALGATGDPETAPHLIPMLADTDIFVRMASARILGDLRAQVAIPHLIDTLEDPEASVRQEAIDALEAITGLDHKFQADAREQERARRVKAWRAWWEDAREELGL